MLLSMKKQIISFVREALKSLREKVLKRATTCSASPGPCIFCSVGLLFSLHLCSFNPPRSHPAPGMIAYRTLVSAPPGLAPHRQSNSLNIVATGTKHPQADMQKAKQSRRRSKQAIRAYIDQSRTHNTLMTVSVTTRRTEHQYPNRFPRIAQ